jgi:hypothetical protein
VVCSVTRNAIKAPYLDSIDGKDYFVVKYFKRPPPRKAAEGGIKGRCIYGMDYSVAKYLKCARKDAVGGVEGSLQ